MGIFLLEIRDFFKFGDFYPRGLGIFENQGNCAETRGYSRNSRDLYPGDRELVRDFLSPGLFQDGDFLGDGDFFS